MDNKAAPQAVVLDLGKHTTRRVRDLKKGKGDLLADVHSAVDQLRQKGVVTAGAQTVVVVVERKAIPALFPFLVR